MSYESHHFNEIVGPQLLRAAEEKAAGLHTKYSPNLAPFMEEDVYGQLAVKKDLEYVLKMEQKFKNSETAGSREKKRISNVFEIFFLDAANNCNWFGDGTEIMKTTKYDDYKNGVDITATFMDNDRPDHLALSTDLTFGTGASENKLEGIIEDIRHQKMGQLRYFHSEYAGYTGRLQGIPKTIVGLDRENVAAFIRLWTHDSDNPEIETYRNIILTQLMDQLHFFMELADQQHGESPIQRRYARAHKIVGSFWKKQNIDRSSLPSDAITKHIQSLK